MRSRSTNHLHHQLPTHPRHAQQSSHDQLQHLPIHRYRHQRRRNLGRLRIPQKSSRKHHQPTISSSHTNTNLLSRRQLASRFHASHANHQSQHLQQLQNLTINHTQSRYHCHRTQCRTIHTQSRLTLHQNRYGTQWHQQHHDNHHRCRTQKNSKSILYI